MRKWVVLSLVMVASLLVGGCKEGAEDAASAPEGETAIVTEVIDGDTIEVQIGNVGYRVRYVGVNTPERDEPCYADAADANARLVEGKTVRLVQDTSNTDRYGRLLRYVFVGNVFVNEELVRQGYAEAVLYQPDDRYYDDFLALERQAKDENHACHATGIFNDGSETR